MTINDISSTTEEVEKVDQLIMKLIIGYKSWEMMDLACPKKDGEEDAKAVAEMRKLKYSADCLSDACKILIRKLTQAIIYKNEFANK